MSGQKILKAANLLIEARRSGALLAELPVDCKPKNVEEAHAIQDAVNEGLGERIGGWKANAPPGEDMQRGAIFDRLIFTSPARIPARKAPMLGVEAEIAFQFLDDLPLRERDYSREEVARSIGAFAAIEIVDARIRNYDKVPLLDRIADNICNGAFVRGATVLDWRKLDIAKLRVRLEIGGKVIADKIGGHPIDDPLGPVVALVNHRRMRGGVKAGQVVTTGSCTGIEYAKPGQVAKASFDGLGSVEVAFTD